MDSKIKLEREYYVHEHYTHIIRVLATKNGIEYASQSLRVNPKIWRASYNHLLVSMLDYIDNLGDAVVMNISSN